MFSTKFPEKSGHTAVRSCRVLFLPEINSGTAGIDCAGPVCRPIFLLIFADASQAAAKYYLKYRYASVRKSIRPLLEPLSTISRSLGSVSFSTLIYPPELFRTSEDILVSYEQPTMRRTLISYCVAWEVLVLVRVLILGFKTIDRRIGPCMISLWTLEAGHFWQSLHRAYK